VVNLRESEYRIGAKYFAQLVGELSIARQVLGEQLAGVGQRLLQGVGFGGAYALQADSLPQIF